MNRYTVTVEFDLHAEDSEAAMAIVEQQLTHGAYVGQVVNVEGDDD